MLDNSFQFGNIDMRARFGLIAEDFEDVLSPKPRERKVKVPGHDGAYDFGVKAHDERGLRVKCGTVELLTRAACRELSYVLSKKSRIVRWDEPDKYYIGRIYSPSNIAEIVATMKRFTLTFTCDPFAYGKTDTVSFVNAIKPAYPGTAQTPTRVSLKNIGETPITGIQIRIRTRRDNY